MEPKYFVKAIYAFLSSLVASLGLVAEGGITLVEALGVAGAVIAITGGVLGLTNEPLPIDVPGRIDP